MTEQMPDLGIGKATSGAKASLERLVAWAKKNPALVVGIVAGVVILALVVSKRKRPVERGAGVPEGDPLGGLGMGDILPEAPMGDVITFPELPEIPEPTPSNGNGTAPSTTPIPTIQVSTYTPASPQLTEMQQMGIDIVHKIRDDPSIPSNIGEIWASNYRKAQMIAKREKARIAGREQKTRRALAARILARRSSATPATDRKRPSAVAARRRYKSIDSSRDEAKRRKRMMRR